MYAAHANWQTGLCWPSKAVIATLAGVERKRVREAVNGLVQYGFLTEEGVERQRVVYRVLGYGNREPGAESAPGGESGPQGRNPPLVRADRRGGGAKSAPGGGAKSAPGGGAKVAPQNINTKPIRETSHVHGSKIAFGDECDVDVLVESLNSTYELGLNNTTRIRRLFGDLIDVVGRSETERLAEEAARVVAAGDAAGKIHTSRAGALVGLLEKRRRELDGSSPIGDEPAEEWPSASPLDEAQRGELAQLLVHLGVDGYAQADRLLARLADARGGERAVAAAHAIIRHVKKKDDLGEIDDRGAFTASLLRRAIQDPAWKVPGKRKGGSRHSS